jgi:hypothetical protein
MADFAKKIKKMSRGTTTAIALEPNGDTLNMLTEVFGTVFSFSVIAPDVKKRNMIYRETVEDTSSIPEVGMIFVELDGLLHLPAFRSTLKNNQPTILINSGEYVTKKISKWLSDEMHYGLVDLAKSWQVWKYKQGHV